MYKSTYCSLKTVSRVAYIGFCRIIPCRRSISMHGSSRTRTSVRKATKHGPIILAIPGHYPPTDLTVFVDVAINPGPCPTAFESSFQVQSLASSSQIHADRNLHNLEVQKPLIQYTSEQLYGLRSNHRPTDMTLFGKLKDLGIYR